MLSPNIHPNLYKALKSQMLTEVPGWEVFIRMWITLMWFTKWTQYLVNCNIRKEMICHLILIHHMSRDGRIGQEFYYCESYIFLIFAKTQCGTHQKISTAICQQRQWLDGMLKDNTLYYHANMFWLSTSITLYANAFVELHKHRENSFCTCLKKCVP